MDLASKKRKADENGSLDTAADVTAKLLPEDARRLLEPLTKEQLLDVLQEAACRHGDVLDAVRSLTDGDVSLRKLFIRGLGWDTTTDGLRSHFSAFGELQEAIVIVDKASGKSKGYGFITFKHADGALLALKDPSKLIDGRMTVTQLASAGVSGGPPAAQPSADISLRKIFVGNVPFDMPAERLLQHFLVYGEIEEGPLGYDKATGKSKGYALFVYKTPEGASASLAEPNKIIEGHQLVCKLAIDGKKARAGGFPGAGGVPGQLPQGGAEAAGGVGAYGSGMRGMVPGSYGGPGGMPSYGGYANGGGSGNMGSGPLGQVGIAQQYSLSSSLQSSMGAGASGVPAGGGQTGSGGFGGGYYGGSSQYGTVGGGSGSGGLGGTGLSAGAGGYGSLGYGTGYQMQQGSSASGGFPEGGSYGGLQGQHQQPAGSSPSARIPPRAGMYQQGMPPYY